MTKYALLAWGLGWLVVVLAISPAWGQRLRFAQTPPKEEAASADSSQPIASPPPPKPSATPPEDARPAAPSVEGLKMDALPQPATPPLARRIPPGEIIDTPPPIFLEPDAAYPLYDYPSYGVPEQGTLFPRWRPPLWGDAWWMDGASVLNGGGFAQLLYLRPRDTEIALAVPGPGPVVVGGELARPLPQGSTLTLEPDHEFGYRAGVFLPTAEFVSLQATYTRFESDTQTGRQLSAAQINQGLVLFPLLIHPRTPLAPNATNVAARGRLDVDFETIDLDTRLVLWDSPALRLTGYGGVRWAELDQELTAAYTINGGTAVQVSSRYDGLGPRLGLDGYGAVGRWGFGYYGRTDVSFLFGEAKGGFRQFPANNPGNLQALNDWEADRLSPVYELEMGLQWMGPQRRVRLSFGYLINVWFNTINAEEVVQGLQENAFDDRSDTITFDGLTARVELSL